MLKVRYIIWLAGHTGGQLATLSATVGLAWSCPGSLLTASSSILQSTLHQSTYIRVTTMVTIHYNISA